MNFATSRMGSRSGISCHRNQWLHSEQTLRATTLRSARSALGARRSAPADALASRSRTGHHAAVGVDEEAEQYRTTLEQMATLEEGTMSAGEWNRLVQTNHDSYLLLRETETGRSAIEALMSHTSSTARSWSAAHALLWNQPHARHVLEAFAADGSLASDYAEHTLKEFDRGRLSHDW